MIIKSKKMRWVQDTQHAWKKKSNAYRDFVGKPKGKRPLERPRHR